MPLLAVILAAITTGGIGCRPAEESAEISKTTSPVSVDIVTAQQTTMERTTTQPATVHAYYETRVFAKAAGYLAELNVDIGTLVKKGDVLAVLRIPEMAKQRETKLAVIQRLQADERRAAAQVTVAEAGIVSYQAKQEQAKAVVGKADAELAALRVELSRVKDLVKQQAVTDSLQDETQKRHDAAVAQRAAAQAGVTSAEAELALANAQREAAGADLDVAKSETDIARRELDELDELMKYATLTAPFDGVVTQRNVDPGDLARNTQSGSGDAGSPLFLIAKIDQVRVRVAIPEHDVSFANVGDTAEIALQALPDQSLQGTITRVTGVLDEHTRTMMVEIDMPNADGKLRPGMFGQAKITLAPPSNTLTLPANAVRFDEHGNSYVFVVDASNQVAIAEVETGLDSGKHIEITGGLSDDKRVVGPLLRRLKAGQKVTVN